MAVPDISSLTPAELVTLIQQANARYTAAQAATATDVQTRRQSAAAAVHTLTALLGPSGAAAGTTSIRAVRAFDALDVAAKKPAGTTMAANAPIALSLIFQALEQLTATALDVATIVAADQR